ncbi:MAG: 3-oxoacyl-ACP synthase [Bacteroidota bacterium]
MTIKLQLYQQLQERIDKRVKNAQKAVLAAQDSKSNQTKSSAGDKFETGRAMMQAEEDRCRSQLAQALTLQNELARLPFRVPSATVKRGSLVGSDQANYFISVGLGKLEIANTIYYAISLASPIGQLLQDKQVGETIDFRGKTITVQSID